VAVSINRAQILKYRALPVRAAETLSVLVGLLLLAVSMLVPGQGHVALGIEMLALDGPHGRPAVRAAAPAADGW
jgi:hypothetical protein